MTTDHRLSRRSALLTAAGGLLLPSLRPAPAAALQNFYDLGPDWTINWRAHRTSSSATVTQIPGGVRTATPKAAASVDAGQLALWAKRAVAGDFEARFTYKVLSRVEVAGGSFACFHLSTLGEGSRRYPKAVPGWASVTPADALYADHARGLRFSFATFNPAEPDLHHRLRLRSFAFTPTLALVGAASPQLFPFATGVAHDVRVRRAGATLTVSVAPAGDEAAAQSFSWTDARVGRWGGGHVGFRWRGQDVELTGASVAAL